jgi:hypothetical protein
MVRRRIAYPGKNAFIRSLDKQKAGFGKSAVYFTKELPVQSFASSFSPSIYA